MALSRGAPRRDLDRDLPPCRIYLCVRSRQDSRKVCRLGRCERPSAKVDLHGAREYRDRGSEGQNRRGAQRGVVRSTYGEGIFE